MASKIQIWNMALARIGVSQFVQSETEKSNEANVCRVFFDPTVEFALRDADWNFARRYVPLALDTSPILTGLAWIYKYVYPGDCVMARAIVPPGLRVPRSNQRIPFEVANEISGAGEKIFIYTDQPSAVLRYTKRITDTTLFDAQFTSADAYLLGSEIASPLSVKPDVAAQARQGYAQIVSRATATNLREAEQGPEPDPEIIAVRNGG